jgi:hypothetical protein
VRRARSHIIYVHAFRVNAGCCCGVGWCACVRALENLSGLNFFPAAWALFSPCATFIIFQTRGLNCAEVKSESNQRAAETLLAVWNMCHGARKTRWHIRYWFVWEKKLEYFFTLRVVEQYNKNHI